MKYQATSTDYIDILKDLEQRYNITKTKISNIMAAIEEGIITPTTKERLQDLEALKNDLEYKIAVQKARNFRFSKSQLQQFFKSFKIEQATTWQEKQTIVRHLIDRIYVWEDKILLLFNFGNNSGGNPDQHEKDIEIIIKAITEHNGSVIAKYGSSSVSPLISTTYEYRAAA